MTDACVVRMIIAYHPQSQRSLVPRPLSQGEGGRVWGRGYKVAQQS